MWDVPGASPAFPYGQAGSRCVALWVAGPGEMAPALKSRRPALTGGREQIGTHPHPSFGPVRGESASRPRGYRGGRSTNATSAASGATPLRRYTIGDPCQTNHTPGHEYHECPRGTAPSGHYSVEDPSMFDRFHTTSATSVARACGASTTPLGHYSVEALLHWGAETYNVHNR